MGQLNRKRGLRWLLYMLVIGYFALSLFYSGEGYAPQHRRIRDHSSESPVPAATTMAAQPSAPASPGARSGSILCLSGGGYRAMLFHAGVLWRFNEAGLLSKLDGISSVSGGSIIAGLLGTRWHQLGFDASGVATNLQAEIVSPIRDLAATTIDVRAIGVGLATPRTTSDGIVKSYRLLYGNATLQDFPDSPVFYINATNLRTGRGWTFSKRSMGDSFIGRTRDPELDVAVAVAASSGFPPFLAPVRLNLKGLEFYGVVDGEALYREYALLVDGGVEDNLGLGPTPRFETVLISDGGGRSKPIAYPATDWLSITARVLNLIHDQPSALRKRQAITAFVEGRHKGVYLALRKDLLGYPVPDPLMMPGELTERLTRIPTRLSKLDERTQESLINWGYIVADAGLRGYIDPAIPRSNGLPYPNLLR